MNRNPPSSISISTNAESLSPNPKLKKNSQASPTPSPAKLGALDSRTTSPRRCGKWTLEEDERLKAAVQRTGAKNWRKVADIVGGRTSIQCLHRWTKILQPGLVKGAWTKEEDNLLRDWVRKEGATKWAQAAQAIVGRSGKQIRERWFNILNPELKKGNWN